MDRRTFVTALAGGVFAPRFGRWFRQGSGLLVPREGLWRVRVPATPPAVFTEATMRAAFEQAYRKMRNDLDRWAVMEPLFPRQFQVPGGGILRVATRLEECT